MNPRIGFGLAGAVVLGAVVAGLIVLGSPAEERARRLDDRRVRDLSSIDASTDLFWTREERLPESLAELAEAPGVPISIVDPASGEPYEYIPTDSMQYTLCADFETVSEEVSTVARLNRWNHGVGRHCYTLEAEDMNERERPSQ